MRAVTLNLFGPHGDWRRRRPPLIAGLRDLDPDVALFQEAVVTADFDQVTDLVGDEFHVAHLGVRGEDGSGVSIASRWPLGEVRELDLRGGTPVAGFPAGALVADVLWPGRELPLLVVNHKPSWRSEDEDERRTQASVTGRCVEEIVARTGQPVLLGGDFDAEPDAPSVRYWSDSLVGFEDVWRLCRGTEPGPTFAPSANPLIHEPELDGKDRRIDYLFVSPGRNGPRLVPSRCELLFIEPVDGAWVSDHFGVMAEFAA